MIMGLDTDTWYTSEYVGSDFRYSWEQCSDGVILRIAGGTFTISHESYSLLDRISDVDKPLTITSKYSAKITLGKVTSTTGVPTRIILSFFDAWGEPLGIYFIPLPMYDEMIIRGYVAMERAVKI